MHIRIRSAALALLAVLGLSQALAQSTELIMSPESKMWIDGTSNKSDWTVTVTEMTGSLVLDDGGHPTQATVMVAADKIESDRSKIMDLLMYRALKTNAHPKITYTLTSVGATVAGDSLQTVGDVEVAGVTKSAPLTVQWVTEDNGVVRVRGSHPMKMTEFGMKPPTAMFGALHTGDDVLVHFDVAFVPSGATGS